MDRCRIFGILQVHQTYSLVLIKSLTQFIFGILFFLSTVQCNLIPLQVESIVFCDLWDNNGYCKEIWDGNSREYKIPISDFNKMKSYKDLFHYLYFSTRETPGVLLHWNRNLTDSELARETRLDCRFHYTYNDKTHIMQGFEANKNFLGGFQYLTSIIEDDFQESNRMLVKPSISELSNIPINFHRTCGKFTFNSKVVISIVTID